MNGTQDIVVTGSRIARAELATTQPTQIINETTIRERGYTNVAQALQELPGFGPAGASSSGTQSAFGPGQNFSDFFGLGSQRTLTLVNGRRFVSSNTASVSGEGASPGSQVDLNTIPVSLIQRVDVVAVGGAPIYGSDAIAGTVNIILRKDYQGLEIGGQYGLTARRDAPDKRFNVLAGRNFADGRGNITLSGEYNQATGLVAADRAVTRRGLFFGRSTDPDNPQQILYPDRRQTAFSEGGVPFISDAFNVFPLDDLPGQGVFGTNGQALQFGSNGRLTTLDPGLQTGDGFTSVGGNGYDSTRPINLLTGSRRYLANALASYEFSDHLRFFGEGWYSRTRTVNLVNQPNYQSALLAISGQQFSNLPISIDNPYLDPADRATIEAQLPEGQNQFYLGRVLSDLASGRATLDSRLYRFVGGFNGDFNLGSHRWTWEASANYGRFRGVSTQPQVVNQNLFNAIDAIRAPDGSITCRPGAINSTALTRSGICAPLDILGSGRGSAAALSYVLADARTVSTNTQLVFNANTQGSILALPGGDLKASLGYEHRRETTSFDPGDFFFGGTAEDGTRFGYGQFDPVNPFSGRFHTNEVFAELTAPVVSSANEMRFLKVLEFDGAARYVRNSIVGGDVTWTAGGRFGLVRGVTFRGNYTRSIRNPSLPELLTPPSRASVFAGADPCDQSYVNSGPNPSRRRANCIAGGIADPDTFSSLYVTSLVPTTIQGNANLQSEKANSWTAGVVLQPTFLRGFSATVDWVDIRLNRAIQLLTGDQTLAGCYDAADFTNNDFCNRITRNGDGQITNIDQTYFNAASYRMSALTANVSYRRRIDGIGTLGLNVNYMYRNRLEQRGGQGDIDHIAGEIGYPRHSGTASVSWGNDVLDALVQVRYVGKGVFNADAKEATDVQGVKAWTVVNATLGAKVGKQFDLQFVVNNIGDRKPPYPYISTSQGSAQTYFDGVFGRSYRVSVQFHY